MEHSSRRTRLPSCYRLSLEQTAEHSKHQIINLARSCTKDMIGRGGREGSHSLLRGCSLRRSEIRKHGAEKGFAGAKTAKTRRSGIFILQLIPHIWGFSQNFVRGLLCTGARRRYFKPDMVRLISWWHRIASWYWSEKVRSYNIASL